MKISQLEYELQIRKARKTLQKLQNRLREIESLLQDNPGNTSYLREMDKICLDITITENELEHALSCIEQQERPILNDNNQNWTA